MKRCTGESIFDTGTVIVCQGVHAAKSKVYYYSCIVHPVLEMFFVTFQFGKHSPLKYYYTLLSS